MTSKPKAQIQKFRDTARRLEANEDEGRFNKTLGKVARAKVPSKAELEEIARAIGNLPPHPKKPGK